MCGISFPFVFALRNEIGIIMAAKHGYITECILISCTVLAHFSKRKYRVTLKRTGHGSSLFAVMMTLVVLQRGSTVNE